MKTVFFVEFGCYMQRDATLFEVEHDADADIAHILIEIEDEGYQLGRDTAASWIGSSNVMCEEDWEDEDEEDWIEQNTESSAALYDPEEHDGEFCGEAKVEYTYTYCSKLKRFIY